MYFFLNSINNNELNKVNNLTAALEESSMKYAKPHLPDISPEYALMQQEICFCTLPYP